MREAAHDWLLRGHSGCWATDAAREGSASTGGDGPALWLSYPPPDWSEKQGDRECGRGEHRANDRRTNRHGCGKDGHHATTAQSKDGPAVGRLDAIPMALSGVGLIFVIASGLAIEFEVPVSSVSPPRATQYPTSAAAQGDTQPMSAAVSGRDMFGQPIAVILALRRHVVGPVV